MTAKPIFALAFSGVFFCIAVYVSHRAPLVCGPFRGWKPGGDPEAAAFVRSVADGNETVPTVTVAGKAMVNPSKGRLLEAVRTHAPHLAPGAGRVTGERD
ncbi:hypothetical protein [Streptosporangium canum]|uniref:hypothetical protein n=1 Tax=Streptosporangium canum TaxID=324952 RepID=UPI001C43496A|nr:hypothetical protein [Streptosporangium canum]